MKTLKIELKFLKHKLPEKYQLSWGYSTIKIKNKSKKTLKADVEENLGRNMLLRKVFSNQDQINSSWTKHFFIRWNELMVVFSLKAQTVGNNIRESSHKEYVSRIILKSQQTGEFASILGASLWEMPKFKEYLPSE